MSKLSDSLDLEESKTEVNSIKANTTIQSWLANSMNYVDILPSITSC